MSKYEKNYVPSREFWNNFHGYQEEEEVIPLEINYERSNMTGFLQDRQYSSLAASVVAPVKAAAKRFGTTRDFGFREPVIATYMPVTEELEEAFRDKSPLWHLTKACDQVVKENNDA